MIRVRIGQTGRTILGGVLAVCVVAAMVNAQQPPAAPSTATTTPPVAEAGTQQIAETQLERATIARDRITAILADFEVAKQTELTRHQSAVDYNTALADRIKTCVAGSNETAAIYNEAVTELTRARVQLRVAINNVRAPSLIPNIAAELRASTTSFPALEADSGTTALAISDLEESQFNAIETEHNLRWVCLENASAEVAQLNQLRIQVLEKADATTRADVLGLTRHGVAQLQRELGHLRLSATAYWLLRMHSWQILPQRLDDVFLVGAMTYTALKLLLVIAVFAFLRVRLRPALDSLRRVLFRRFSDIAWKRRADSVLGILKAIAPWVLFIIFVVLLRRTAGAASLWPELALTFQLALIYGWYRLGIDGTVDGVLRIAARYGLRPAPDNRRKLITSIRAVAKVIAVLMALLLISETVVGRGYLYHLLVLGTWVIGALSVVGLLVSWRSVLSETLLEIHPSGRLAGIVRASQDRWFGLFVTPASFLALAGRAVLTIARDFALGFDKTRKAMAFVFRRKVERLAEQKGYADTTIENLSPRLREAFTQEPVGGGELVLQHFPGMDRFATALERWRSERTGGCFLVTGERGIGKSSWLAQIEPAELQCSRLALEDRLLSAEDLVKFISDGLGIPECSDLGVLVEALNSGPARIIILDLAQHLFLSTVGGYRGLSAFVDLAHRTNPNIFWVSSISAYAWAHLRSVRPDLAVFDHHVALKAWAEDDLRKLIHTRIKASGIVLTYRDLVVDRLEGVAARDRLIESEEGYTRLLWDYSDGNPRVALHFFQRSLVPVSEQHARVRLFRAPLLEGLEQVDERALFVLAALITHESLTVEEAAIVTRFSLTLCGLLLERLRSLGVVCLVCRRYRISTFWHRAAIRLLRRHNLLPR